MCRIASAVMVVLVACSQGLAGWCGDFTDSIFCDDFDRYCLSPPPSPQSCPDDSPRDDSSLRSVWEWTSYNWNTQQSEGANAVVEELYQRLDSLVKATYGAERSIYLEQQLRHIRIRLMRYAEFHCKRSLDGWRTKEEWIEVDAEKDLVVDDIPFRIQGRIDRIEYRDDTNEYAILDLKTSDRRTVPEESHRQGPRNAKVWTDLQLPLYRQIAPIPSGSSIKVGYILLDGAEDRPPLAIADWTDADYASALDRAEEIIRGVRAGVFWPPSMVVPTWDDDLSSICMDRSPYRQALIARAPSIWG